MRAYQHRVVEEKQALDDKLTKLMAFMDTSLHYQRLTGEEKDLLVAQRILMRAYSDVLATRIAIFQEEIRYQ